MSHFLAPNERTICFRHADLKHSHRVSVQRPHELWGPDFRQSAYGSLSSAYKKNCPLEPSGNEAEESWWVNKHVTCEVWPTGSGNCSLWKRQTVSAQKWHCRAQTSHCDWSALIAFHLCLVSHWLGELPFCCAYGGIAVHHLRDFSCLQDLNQGRLSLPWRTNDDHLHKLALLCLAQLRS